MAHGISVPSEDRPLPHGPKRLLALRGDEHLVAGIRRGDEVAFEVIYERHMPGVLSFCRHMLGSREEAEDAVQHTFTSAHRALLRDAREIRLKAWLYAIARNRCLSMLRARREQPDDSIETSTLGLDADVERRAELRELVADLQDLPEDQREALVLSELRDLSHGEVADILGCKVANVKGLVFRARTGLSERREARDASCEAIQVELSTAQGATLRLRHHLRSCAPCRAYLDEVRRQRKMMAAILPVIPTAGLKSGVFAAAGVGGAAGGGGGAAAGGGGILAGLTTAGGATVAKVAVISAVVAGGGGLAGHAALDDNGSASDSAPPASPRARAGARSGGPEPAGSAQPKGAESGPAGATKHDRSKAEKRREEAKKAKRTRSRAGGRSKDSPAADRGRRRSPPKPVRKKARVIAPKAHGNPMPKRVRTHPTTPAKRRKGTVVPPKATPAPVAPPAHSPRRSAPDG